MKIWSCFTLSTQKIAIPLLLLALPLQQLESSAPAAAPPPSPFAADIGAKEERRAPLLRYSENNISSSSAKLLKRERGGRRSYNDFSSNPHTSKRYKALMHSHILPSDHPIKGQLDSLFTKGRVTTSRSTFEAAGFTLLPTHSRSYITVASHSALKGFLLKLYLDEETRLKRGEEGWVWLWRRCELAKKIERVISKERCHLFAVPKKWIYPLPPPPSNEAGHYCLKKNELLVVEDMELATKEESLRAWRAMTPEHLRQLYRIISYAGGSSYREDNIPYSRTGKFVFIDTEYLNKSPNYDTVLDYLSEEMKLYWKELVRKGGVVE